ncbi:POTRA domain-containing protein, FtsQ-type [Ruminococcus flavefaciens]|uniref:POTRA domain-containing protein, FtsQ-type n=1 Tax=Ruminococcus flavefaciens TaxID=1265 RepID=A0A1H6HZ20_RUMFL|nr:FtsQ-type POTRA domain-containing protein [Ruminococcus flavefaciens]SEH40994.1 POTRA domain-containing protein, FtsQ-type [Ruminococcus flavefaciens]
MKDVEKTSVERKNSRKRIRRRKRMMNVYGLVGLLLAITAGITISYTFLFNISEIRVSGESDMYSAEEIVVASGIKEGDNLLRLDLKKSEQRILDELLYVETAKVKRDFPSSLEITVTRCIPAFNVQYEGGVLIVSKKGKILASNDFITEGLPVISGLEPSQLTPGKPVASENEHKNEAFHELIKTMVSMGDDNISIVDMSDEHSIIVQYKNDMIFKMGNWNDVEYKLNLAKNVMNDDTVKGKKGYLTMIGSNQCSFRTSDSPASTPGIIEPTTQPKTDEYGNPIDEIGSGERNPEQEADFDRINSTTAPTQPEPETEAQNQWTDNGYDYNSGYDDGSQWQNDNGYDNGGGYSDNSGDYGNYDGATQQW